MSGPVLIDTTLKSVVFGSMKQEIVYGDRKKATLKNKVSQYNFDNYLHILKIFAQLSRIIYCDSGIIGMVLLSNEFGTNDNIAVNNLITSFDSQVKARRKMASTYPESVSGRPMESYVLKKASNPDVNSRIATYISTPDDVTFMFLKGSKLMEKNPFFKETDIILTFKGSSTLENFKHDLYSQFTRAEITPGKYVPGAFLKHIKDNMSVIMGKLSEYNPGRLFITGHSLGGAYATIFTYLLLLSNPNYPIHLVTFGAPTVVSDSARNEFNSFLDAGRVTLDSIVSKFGKIRDIIPSIPAAYSHPGFRPLQTEMYPEFYTGRAYHIPTVEEVYVQKGGLLGFNVRGALGVSPEKRIYEEQTKSHMPNRLLIPVRTVAGKGFAHAEYFDMTFLGAFRTYGLKNPGFRGNTFVADIYSDGIDFRYIPANLSIEAAPEPAGEGGLGDLASPLGNNEDPKPPVLGGTTRKRRYNKKMKSTRRR